jgi:hypothetical protein
MGLFYRFGTHKKDEGPEEGMEKPISEALVFRRRWRNGMQHLATTEAL